MKGSQSEAFLLMHAVVEAVGKLSNQDHQVHVLKAINIYNNAIDLFRAGESDKAIIQHQLALEEIKSIPGVHLFQATIYGSLIAPYTMTNRGDDAISAGRTALELLAVETNLPYLHAQILQDLGGALLQHNNIEEGILHLEKALDIYKTLPDGEPGVNRCRHNLEVARAKQSNKKTGFNSPQRKAIDQALVDKWSKSLASIAFLLGIFSPALNINLGFLIGIPAGSLMAVIVYTFLQTDLQADSSMTRRVITGSITVGFLGLCTGLILGWEGGSYGVFILQTTVITCLVAGVICGAFIGAVFWR